MTPMRIINPFRSVRQSFRTRVFALLTLLILVTTVAFTTFYVLHESSAATERLVTEGNFLAGLLAYNCRLAVFAENQEMLRETTDGILFHQNVISAGVFTSEGKLLIERKRQLDPVGGRGDGGTVLRVPDRAPVGEAARDVGHIIASLRIIAHVPS